MIHSLHSQNLASPIVYELEKDGRQQFCMDCRTLNPMTVKVAYTIAKMDKCLVLLGAERIFSTLFADSGYRQIQINDREKDKKN